MEENPRYLSDQLITYLGNKRALLEFIGKGLEMICSKLGIEKISTFDVFSGSGVVSRFLKKYSSLLITNDLENYSSIINQCYLANREDLDLGELHNFHRSIIERLGSNTFERGIISRMYAPDNDNDIKEGERVFYTKRNAGYLDTARSLITELPSKYQHFFLAPLLSEASIHANTSGVFKGFYKDSDTGIGTFGGKNQDALTRIRGNIALPFPIFSEFNCETMIMKGDANKICESIPEVDLAYLDPPYNQHPYGSNYFMLNLLIDQNPPQDVSAVSGIPPDWQRSVYNKRKESSEALRSLIEKLKAKYLIVSFNSEGFIELDEMTALLKTFGKVDVLETKYNAFRGSRNLSGRNLHVKEYLYLLEKN